MFAEWLNQKYKEWRGDEITREYSVSAFARYLGITQQNVDDYLKGESVPRQTKIINKLVEKYGAEVYKAIGLNITAQEEVVIEINRLPEELYPELITRIRELRADYIAQKSAQTENSDLQDE